MGLRFGRALFEKLNRDQDRADCAKKSDSRAEHGDDEVAGAKGLFIPPFGEDGKKDGNTDGHGGDGGEEVSEVLLHMFEGVGVFEFFFDLEWCSDALDGGGEGRLGVCAGVHPVLDIIAEMVLQFVEGDGCFESGGEHLLAPGGNLGFEVTHVFPPKVE